jgi:hypothetical protein
MQWVKAALTLLQLIQFVVLKANERRLKDEGAAEAIEAAAKEAINDINTAREARLRVRAANADPARLRDDDGFRRD